MYKMQSKSIIEYSFWTDMNTFLEITTVSDITSILKTINWASSIHFFPEKDDKPVCITFYGPVDKINYANTLINSTLIDYPEMILKN